MVLLATEASRHAASSARPSDEGWSLNTPYDVYSRPQMCSRTPGRSDTVDMNEDDIRARRTTEQVLLTHVC